MRTPRQENKLSFDNTFVHPMFRDGKNRDLALIITGTELCNTIKREFDTEYNEFVENSNAENLKYKDDPDFLFTKSYDKPFNPDFETIYRQNLKEYKRDFPQASDKAFIQDEIDRLESIKRKLKWCLKVDFETPEWKAIGVYCEFLKVKEAGKPLREKKTIRPFIEYLKHSDKVGLLKVLHKLIEGKKGREIALIIRALEQKKFIELENRELNMLYVSMSNEFGNIGTPSAINLYMNRELNTTKNSRGVSMQNEIDTIIDKLPTN